MPFFKFKCPKCDTVVEKLTDRETKEIKCTNEKCDASMKRQISVPQFHLKGGGWYSDGYSNKK